MSDPYKPEYWIRGERSQFVEIELDPGKMVFADRGSLMRMDDGIEIKPIEKVEKRKGNNWREKLREMNRQIVMRNRLLAYTNTGQVKRRAAFAAPYPGRILPIDLAQFDGELFCHRESFLCATNDVTIGFEYIAKQGERIFDYRSIILKKLMGDGLAFIHSGGSIEEKELQAGEKIWIDTGYLLAMTKNIALDFVKVSGIKHGIYHGGEKVSFATLTGPGKVWLSVLPFNRFVNRAFFRYFFPEF